LIYFLKTAPGQQKKGQKNLPEKKQLETSLANMNNERPSGLGY